MGALGAVSPAFASSSFKTINRRAREITRNKVTTSPLFGLTFKFVFNCPQHQIHPLHNTLGQSLMRAQRRPLYACSSRARAHTSTHMAESSLTFIWGVDDGEDKDDAGQ